jgi:hypothetical protein
MHGFACSEYARAKRLMVVLCLVILCASQMLIPAARLQMNLGSSLPASDIAVVASEQSRNGQVPCGQDVRTCLNIKLAQLRIASAEPDQRGFNILVFPRNAATRMTGLMPTVPTPPPRPA